MAEAVNTACYVQNRVLVVKPHNKTSYELFRDYLGKFDGKSDEEFFVGYSLNSDGPKWLFDINVLTKSMNYVPVVTGTNSNDFVGTEESIGAGHSSKETGSSQDCILMPLKDNSSQDINTVGPSISTASTNITTGSLNINTVSPTVTTARSNGSQTEPDMFSLGDNATLEATHVDFFGDETEVDMSNITTTYLVPSTPNTRIHKDHSLDHVIRDMQSGVQTRRMTKTSNE
ncbi:hypothetical protein Tco_1276535 [Tanacetum coccineum]